MRLVLWRQAHGQPDVVHEMLKVTAGLIGGPLIALAHGDQPL
jgi:hypothetical protein